MNMTIDKQNGNLAFNEASHVYFDVTDPKKKYISVTSLIHKFEPPYDKDFWSAYKAMEQLVDPEYWRLAKKELLSAKTFNPKILDTYNVPVDDFNSVQQNILDSWQKENLASTERGSKIHSDLEHSFYAQQKDISLEKYGLGGRFVCVKDKTELDLDNGLYPEYLIHYDSPDGKINLAGQIDLLVKEGNSFSIIDWKGLPLDTKIPTYNGWSTMGELKEGDKVFDKDGYPCSVIHKSEIHHNPCMKIQFSTGESIIADEDHRWLVADGEDFKNTSRVLTTKEMSNFIKENPTIKLTIEDAKPPRQNWNNYYIKGYRGTRRGYRAILSITPTETVPTQCIEVDSPTSTYLCTENLLVTHNTNKQIKTSSYFNQSTKTSEKLLYPLNDLDSCNLSVYSMQLSTYAWMIQQLHPEWDCKELILVHFGHDNTMTKYKIDYLKDQVEKMLGFWKKQSVLEAHKAQRKRIEY